MQPRLYRSLRAVGLRGVAELLGAGVVERADDDVGERQRAGLARGAGQAEVEDDRVAVGRDHEVRGLDVAVDQPAGVRGAEAVEHLEEVPRGVGDAQRAAAPPLTSW